MLHLLDRSLESFLRFAVPLSREIGVSFDAPDRDWGARTPRPVINLYLWEVRPNLELSSRGEEIVRDDAGRAHRRPVTPLVDCRYLVTAWTNDVRDEHSLLGSTLAAVLGSSEIRPPHLSGALADALPVPMFRIADGGQDHSELWSALGGQLKPGIDLLVTVPVPVDARYVAGADVSAVTVTTGTRHERIVHARRRYAGGRSAAAPGSVVRSPRGTARVTDQQTYLVAAEPADKITVDDDPPAER